MLSAFQGETLTISASFWNMLGFLANPTGLTISIYPYGFKPGTPWTTELDSVDLDAAPTNVALGKYEYDYAIPGTAQVGTWYAYWEGTYGAATVTLVQEFNVVALDGADEGTQYSGQPVLDNNYTYELYLEDIESVDGDVLDYESWFSSAYSPMCAAYNTIAARVSGFLNGSTVTEDNINYLIWQATIEAHAIIPPGHVCNQAYLDLACKNYVEYAVLVSVIQNIVNNPSVVTSKALGDLKVTYGNGLDGLNQMLGKWLDEMKEWERVLNGRGCVTYGGSIPMGIAHQSLFNPDRPPFGRQINEAVGSSAMANDKGAVYPRIRYQSVYAQQEAGVDPIGRNWSTDWLRS